MWLVIGIATAAAVAVILYQRLAEERPDLVTGATRRTAQLAAVVAVLSTAVEGVAEALQATVHRRGLRPSANGWLQPARNDTQEWSWNDDE